MPRPRDDDAAIDLSWVEMAGMGLDALADRLARMSHHARVARHRGEQRPAPLDRTATAVLVAEWLSYRQEEEPPPELLDELRRRAASHEPDAGPSAALLRRVLDHHERRLPQA